MQASPPPHVGEWRMTALARQLNEKLPRRCPAVPVVIASKRPTLAKTKTLLEQAAGEELFLGNPPTHPYTKQ